MKSSGHRKNISNPAFTKIGIGVACKKKYRQWRVLCNSRLPRSNFKNKYEAKKFFLAESYLYYNV